MSSAGETSSPDDRSSPERASSAEDLTAENLTPSRPSRLSTKDLVGPVLIFVGGFLLAAAIALPTLFVDNLRTIPLSTDVTTVAPAASPARVLDRCSLASPTARVVDADLTRQQRFVAVRPADADRVTLQAGTSVRAEHLRIDGREVDPEAPRAGSDARPAAGASACTDPIMGAVRDRITLDRVTALPDLTAAAGQQGSSEIQYDSNSAPVRVPDRDGYTYLMPFGVSTADHTFFDVTTRRTVPLRYTGDTTVAGRDVARFVAVVPDTDLHQIDNGDAQSTPPTIITRPAGWFGVPGVDPARSVSATLHHSGRWELAVDTTTGTIVDAHIAVDETYRFIDTTLPDRRLTSMSATFAYDDRTQRRLTEHATALAAPITVWGRVVPLIAAVVGVATIVAGLAVINPAWRPRRWRPSAAPDADPPASS
ncbi:DUF3068 domain-containing protein [Gordonia hankookensis]|uniref:DUF3068 domain-containing protein n=1 Tax=Gordonia hankookensis TaxID=589403 RepID=A0ABR7WBF2_9ACTN|nr:DUF3068 domain-containing protein [Gordonia hankookensis]MBD1319935.1 DUF3068 domain-containing protein [Gordonia hankookensis]